jgi:hypothetical protein
MNRNRLNIIQHIFQYCNFPSFRYLIFFTHYAAQLLCIKSP